MYKLRSTLKRGTSLSATVALLVAAVVPAVLPATAAYADSLNPLTDRSLTLSSSSPGWSNTDGSGNTTYAPPNSGANGQKTGNYFDFKVSSSATVKGFSFQYCTTSAGNCYVPGNDTVRGTDDFVNEEADLRITYPSAAEISDSTTAGAGTIVVTSGSAAVVGTGTSFTSFIKVGGTIKTAGGAYLVVASIADNTHLTLTANAGATESGVAYSKSDFTQVIDPATGAVKAVPGYTNNNQKYQFNGGTGDPAEAAKAVAGNFIVMYDNGGTWTPSTGWTIATINHDDGAGVTNNYITLVNSSGLALTAAQQVKVLFFATTTDYITNPGANEFYVKINTWDAETLSSGVPDGNVIDGGVTVANVVNQSIQITTKVLETMQFSVGTVDPNTLDSDTTGGTVLSEMDTAYGTAIDATKHTPCDTILKAMNPSLPANVLELGDQNAESSLSTTHTYSTHSYWRLSSNSSAGATVYYSGHTLSNTVGDEIDAIGVTKAAPSKGAEQFGLALDNTSNSNDTTANGVTPEYSADTSGTPAHQNYSVNYAQEATYENAVDNGRTSTHTASLTADGVLANASWHVPRLFPLVATANYNDGTGAIDSSPTAQFAFDPLSDTIPVALASEDTDVVDCVTGKMRYIANIAATTPAGIYTTKVNYIAAPQY